MRIILALLFAAGSCAVPTTASAASQEPQAPVFRSGANEVLVDIVVRDKRGKLVRDLKPGDVTVLENGVPQQVTSFREVRGAGTLRPDREATVQTGKGAEPAVQLQRQIRLVSLVFHGLDTDGRRNARNAALEFVNSDLGPNVYYAVFFISRVFRPVIGYTNDRARIRKAIDLVTGWQKADTGNSAGIAADRGPRDGAPPEAPGNAELRGPNFGASISAMANFNAHMDLNMFGAIDIFGLWGIVSELAKLPGRKTVLYFSEGLGLPFDYRQHYLSMISAANRANVTFYTIDARGLVTSSDMTAVRQSIHAAVNTTQDVTTRAAVEGSGMYGQGEMGFDKAMQSIYNNTQQNLFDLSEKTGGFLIANTNNFTQPMRQLSEDFNTYYEITYRAPEMNYDGRFRAISVKVERPGVKVQSRDGYFALPVMEGQAVFPFEVPLLHALGRPTLARELKYQARVAQFRNSAGERQAVLVFDMPLDQISFMKDESGTKARSYISFLALVKDERGKVAAKLSRDLPLDHPLDRVSQFKQGRSIFTRPLKLAPGRYTLESAVSDNVGGKTGAKRSVLVVGAGDEEARISDVLLVRRMDPASAEPDLSDPLQTVAGKIVPTLEDHFTGGSGGQLAAFLTVYPKPDLPKPVVYLDLLRDGKLVRRAEPPVPPPGADGAAALIGRISLASLPPGSYELRAAVVQGDQGARRSLSVTID